MLKESTVSASSLDTTITSGSILSIPWDDSNTYDFYVMNLLNCNETSSDKRCKVVCEGYFTSKTPNDSIIAGRLYILKRIITLSDVDIAAAHPAAREKYDLLDYPGPRFRSVLARSKDAVLVCEKLESKDCESNVTCYSVEPKYTVITPEDIPSMTAYEKLEYLYQYSTALLELYKLSVRGKTIKAFRDAKLGNSFIERGPDSFKLKIDDMASIYIGGKFPTASSRSDNPTAIENNADVTWHQQTPFSASNTCPEDVFREYGISDKTDVYALGMILAQFFGGFHNEDYDNPNSAFCSSCGWHGGIEELIKSLGKAFEEGMDKELNTSGTTDSWILKFLQEKVKRSHPFKWHDPDIDFSVRGGIGDMIRKLFVSATHINPSSKPKRNSPRRCSMVEFRDGILEIMNALPNTKRRRNLANEALYLPPADKRREDVFVFDTRITSANAQALLKNVQSTATGCFSSWVNACTYNSDGKSKLVSIAPALKSPKDLEKYMEAQTLAAASLNGRSLTALLYSLVLYYTIYGDSVTFSGNVRIFTPNLTEADVKTLGNSEITLDYVLNCLKELSYTGKLNVTVYSSKKPTLTDSSWFEFKVPDDPDTPPPSKEEGEAPYSGSSVGGFGGRSTKEGGITVNYDKNVIEIK